MKKILVFMIALFIVNNVFPQGIEFEHGTFDEALVKAKKENKLVFMDCYTIWCRPCKLLAKNVFPVKNVGDYFNENFVSIKIDMEKGEGIKLRKRYKVEAFPTLLFLNDKGELLHFFIGYAEPDDLIQIAKNAVDPNKNFAALQKKYKSGERDYRFLINYFKILKKNGEYNEAKKIVKEFKASVSNEKLLDADAFDLLLLTRIKYGDSQYKYILNNKESFIALEGVGEDKFDRLISKAIETHLNQFTKGKSLKILKQEIENCKKEYVSLQQEDMENRFVSRYYLNNKKATEWYEFNVSLAENAMTTDQLRGKRIYTNTLISIINNEAVFKKSGIFERAIVLGEKLLKDDKNDFSINYALANMYMHTNNKAKAVENINAYINQKMAQGKKIEYEESELKEEIEKMPN